MAKKKNAEVPKGLVPVPPDGGYGWVIMFASFVVNMLVDGVCFSFGIFYLEFLDYYGESKGKTSWVGSVLNGMYLSMGPIVSALCNKYGCRNVCISGSILAAVSFSLSILSPSVDVLIFLYGAMGGAGFGLMYLPSIVMVGYYFEKKRALATGVAVCGSGIGAFIFAPLSKVLLNTYDWKGGTLIIGALVLNGVLMGALFRPLPLTLVEDGDSSVTAENCIGDSAGETPVTNVKNGDHKSNGHSSNKNQTTTGSNNTELPSIKITESDSLSAPKAAYVRHSPIQSCGYLPTCSAQKGDNKETETHCFISHPNLDGNSVVRHAPSKEKIKQDALRPLYRQDIFYSGSIINLPEYRSSHNIREYVEETTKIPERDCEEEETGCLASTKSCRDTFHTIMDFSLLRSPTFLIYGLSCFLCMTGFFVPFIYLPANAKELGIDGESAAFLVSIIGIANTGARILAGWLSDRPWVDCLLINNLALVLGGVATMLVPFCINYELLAAYSAVFGMSIAVFVSLRSIIMVDLLGLEKLTNAFGLVTLCQGLSSFIGAPIAGTIYDASGSYDISFYVAGATLAAAGIICFPLRCVSRWENKKLGLAASDSINN